MPNRQLLPTLGPLVGFALLTWDCCCLAVLVTGTEHGVSVEWTQ